MNVRLEKIFNILFLAAVFAVFGILFVKNINTFITGIQQQLVSEAPDTAQIEDLYKNNFSFKNNMEDVYGIVQAGMNNNIVGSYEFYKDELGVAHVFAEIPDTQEFADDVIKLNGILKEKNVPLVYVQIPEREREGLAPYPSGVFNYAGEGIKKLKNILTENEISYMDIGEFMLNDPNAPSYEDFYFRTDCHLATDSEWWVLEYFVDWLEDNTDCTFDRMFLDKDNYKKKSYSFLGNFCRSVGRYYTKLDTFDVYFPKYKTSFVFDNSAQGVVKEGAFKKTVMNEYEKRDDINEYLYWVVNYLAFTSPVYTITNNLVDNNRILVICDSMCYRSVSYLSLGCSNITIVDPRYFEGTNYLQNVIDSGEFDAAIVCHQTSLFGNRLFY